MLPRVGCTLIDQLTIKQSFADCPQTNLLKTVPQDIFTVDPNCVKWTPQVDSPSPTPFLFLWMFWADGSCPAHTDVHSHQLDMHWNSCLWLLAFLKWADLFISSSQPEDPCMFHLHERMRGPLHHPNEGVRGQNKASGNNYTIFCSLGSEGESLHDNWRCVWRDSLAAKSAGCSHKGLGFSSEHPHYTSHNYL